MTEIPQADFISLCALILAGVAFVHSLHAWRRQFRPIVTAMVRTCAAGSEAIAYNLVLQNSGVIPARDIALKVFDNAELEAALDDASDEDRRRWLACFEDKCVIPIIQNGAKVSCSFGVTRSVHSFWKPNAKFRIRIIYRGWFGKTFSEVQMLHIVDTSSFTGFYWGS